MKVHVSLAIVVMVVTKNTKLLLELPEVLLRNNINVIIRFSSSTRSFTTAAVKTSDLATFCGVNVI